jgi:triosephosphate isomerase
MTKNPRRLFIAGNWKMNLLMPEAIELADELKRRIGRIRNVDMAIVPSHLYLAVIAKRLAGERIEVGGQDLLPGEFGARTGAVSGPQLVSAGASFVLIGHSERRHVFGDSNAFVAEKLRAALDSGLDAILCIGETLEQRQSDQTFAVCEEQLASALDGITIEQMSRITVAYEPVWAIGTGQTATPAEAQEVHRYCREWILDKFGSEVAESLRIQYGGSVKPANAIELLSQPDIDGALVGGASLNAESFAAIVTCNQKGS